MRRPSRPLAVPAGRNAQFHFLSLAIFVSHSFSNCVLPARSPLAKHWNQNTARPGSVCRRQEGIWLPQPPPSPFITTLSPKKPSEVFRRQEGRVGRLGNANLVAKEQSGQVGATSGEAPRVVASRRPLCDSDWTRLRFFPSLPRVLLRAVAFIESVLITQ